MDVKVFGFGMYGMGGGYTDPAEVPFSQRVRDEVGAEIFDSPYLDDAVNIIAAKIKTLPLSTPVLRVLIFSWGTSLGSNNQTALSERVDRDLDGCFGFQASSWPGAWKGPMTARCKFAHLISSENPLPILGLGNHTWSLTPDFPKASFHQTWRNIPHPGDYDRWSQDLFIHEMLSIKHAAALTVTP